MTTVRLGRFLSRTEHIKTAKMTSFLLNRRAKEERFTLFVKRMEAGWAVP